MFGKEIKLKKMEALNFIHPFTEGTPTLELEEVYDDVLCPSCGDIENGTPMIACEQCERYVGCIRIERVAVSVQLSHLLRWFVRDLLIAYILTHQMQVTLRVVGQIMNRRLLSKWLTFFSRWLLSKQ